MINGNESQREGVFGVAAVIAWHLLRADHGAANKAIEKALETFGPDELADAIRQQMNIQGRSRK